MITTLQNKLKNDKESGFKEMLLASMAHSDTNDFSKFKEFFISVCEPMSELPHVIMPVYWFLNPGNSSWRMSKWTCSSSYSYLQFKNTLLRLQVEDLLHSIDFL